MAEVADTTSVVLVLTPTEAGYLLDLLYAHVGGSLLNDDEPLGRIRESLKAADVQRLHAYNVNHAKPVRYASLYRTPEEAAR